MDETGTSGYVPQENEPVKTGVGRVPQSELPAPFVDPKDEEEAKLDLVKMEKDPAVYQFSKDQSQPDRDATAAEIKAKRAEYFERKSGADEDISRSEQERSEREQNLAEITQQIEDLSVNLDNLNNTLLSKVAHFIESRRVRKEIDTKQEMYQAGTAELEDIVSTLAGLEAQRHDRHELDEAIQVLGEFWGKQSEEWREFQKGERARDIKNICSANNCVVVHAIPLSYHDDNTLLDEGVNWQEKLKILLALEPTIASSTVHKGDNGNRNLWSKMGVILSGGRLQTAVNGDTSSKAEGIKSRTDGKFSRPNDIEEQIRTAIDQRVTYNELIVQNPEYAGFFVCVDRNDDPFNRNEGHEAESLLQIAEFTSGLDMPIYIMEGGKFYRTIPDSERGYLQGDEINLQELLSSRYDINGRRDELIEEVLDDVPFQKEKVAEKEAGLVNCYFAGQENFLQIQGILKIKNHDLENYEKIPYQPAKQRSGHNSDGYRLGEDVIPLGEIPKGKEKTQFFIEKGQTGDFDRIFVRQWKRDGSADTQTWFYPDGKTPPLLRGMSVGLQRDVTSFEDFLQQFEESLDLRKEEERSLGEGLYDRYREYYSANLGERLIKVSQDAAFGLYGFAEEARHQGEEEIAAKVIAIANKYFPFDQYQSIISRRLDETGQFRLTKEDLGVAA